MTVQEFFDKYNNKGIDFDGYYGFQCVDLADQYASEVVGHNLPAVAGAKDFWDHNIAGYDKIANTPDGVPQKGDIIIWGTGVGQYGHIAIFDHGDSNNFTSFDQNWPLNSLCHFQNHNYTGVLGWFHPQSQPVQVVIKDLEITDQTKINLGSQLGELEVQAIKSELLDSRNTIGSQYVQIHELQTQVKDLSDKLFECQNTPPAIEPVDPLAHEDNVAQENTIPLSPTQRTSLLKAILGWFGI